MEKVGLVIKKIPEAIELGKKVMGFLEGRGYEVAVEEESSAELGVRGKRIGDMRADMLVVLGGDGMILKVNAMLEKSIPLLGINFGTTGFLAEVDPSHWKPALEKVVEGNYSIDRRSKLDVFMEGEKKGGVLNEAVVNTASPVKMLHLKVYLDGEVMDEVRSDGVIVATPTGSTAYSMSAGGPIVDPRARAIVVTPICPFRSSAESFVVPDNMEIKVRLMATAKKDAILVIDSQIVADIPPEGEILFRLSEKKFHFVRIQRDFYARIRERL